MASCSVFPGHQLWAAESHSRVCFSLGQFYGIHLEMSKVGVKQRSLGVDAAPNTGFEAPNCGVAGVLAPPKLMKPVACNNLPEHQKAEEPPPVHIKQATMNKQSIYSESTLCIEPINEHHKGHSLASKYAHWRSICGTKVEGHVTCLIFILLSTV